jgi:alkylhydroperoxidase family enzyme
MREGASEDKIRDIEKAASSEHYTPRERVALEYAEGMTITGRGVDDELFERVRAHFSEPEIVELTAAIAFENFRSKFNRALRIEAQGFCAIAPPAG